MTHQRRHRPWLSLLYDLMERATPLLDQPHLESVRDGLTALTPALILGSLALMLRELPLPQWQAMIARHAWIPRGLQMTFDLTYGCLSLYTVCAIAARLAHRKAIRRAWPIGLATLVLSILTFARIRPTPVAQFGPENLVLAELVALLTVEACARWHAHARVASQPGAALPRWLPAVSGALFSLAVLGMACLVRLVFTPTAHRVLVGLASHLASILSSGVACVLAEAAHASLWVVGIDGNLILGSALQPLLTGNAVANGLARWSGQVPPWIYSGLFRAYVTAGGSGATMPLAVYLARSRSTRLRQVGRAGLRPGLFNLNAGIIFGAPILFNPLLALPFVLVTTLNAAAAYLAHALGWVTPAYIYLPGTLPAPLFALLSTGFDIRALMLATCTWLVIPGIVWLPFFRAWERRVLAAESVAGPDQSTAKETGEQGHP